MHGCRGRRGGRGQRACGGGGGGGDGDGDDDILVVSDVDVAFARPGLAALARGYLRGRDAVFQPDSGVRVVANLGLVALRCTADVARLFEATRESVAAFLAGDHANLLLAGGDQRALNKLLYTPGLAGGRAVRWGLWPASEVVARTAEADLGAARGAAGARAYHANDGGHLDRARAMRYKIKILEAWLARENATARCRCPFYSASR